MSNVKQDLKIQYDQVIAQKSQLIDAYNKVEQEHKIKMDQINQQILKAQAELLKVHKYKEQFDDLVGFIRGESLPDLVPAAVQVQVAHAPEDHKIDQDQIAQPGEQQDDKQDEQMKGQDNEHHEQMNEQVDNQDGQMNEQDDKQDEEMNNEQEEQNEQEEEMDLDDDQKMNPSTGSSVDKHFAGKKMAMRPLYDQVESFIMHGGASAKRSTQEYISFVRPIPRASGKMGEVCIVSLKPFPNKIHIYLKLKYLGIDKSQMRLLPIGSRFRGNSHHGPGDTEFPIYSVADFEHLKPWIQKALTVEF